jgi:DNA-directed RNA polymerase I subunit RPA2
MPVPTKKARAEGRLSHSLKQAISGVPADKVDPYLRGLVKPHVDSFNYCVGDGLAAAVADLPVQEMDPQPDKGFPAVKFWIEEVNFGRHMNIEQSYNPKTFPAECRQLGTSYEGPLTVDFCWKVEDGPKQTLRKCIGNAPIMVRSERCHLENLDPKELVKHHEEATEQGGYFILNGIERLIRMIIMPRRNIITAIIRPSMASRGPEYTQYATMMRCVRQDQTGQTVTLMYLNSGACNLRFSMRKQEFFIPAFLLLKCFADPSDEQIYNSIIRAGEKSSFLSDRVEALIDACSHLNLYTKDQVLSYLGQVRYLLYALHASGQNPVHISHIRTCIGLPGGDEVRK